MKLTLLSALMLAGYLCLLTINVFAADDTIGTLTTELPVEVEKNKPFDFEVRLKPRSGDFTGTVNVAMQQNPNVVYEPRNFTLTPGQTQKVSATVVKSNRIQLNAKIEQPIESYRRKPFIVSFTDDAGKPVRLEAGARLFFDASNLLVSLDGENDWRSNIDLPLGKEDDEAKPLQLKATSWYADTGIIKMSLTTPQGYKIAGASVTVSIVPPWWVLMMMGMLGGLMYSMIQFLRDFLQSRRKRTPAAWVRRVSLAVLLGIVPGAFAYLLAAWNILGIKTDTTNLKGFFILGLLFAYVGMDVVLALTAPKKAKTT